MLPNEPYSPPRGSSVVRPQFAGLLTAYTAKFTYAFGKVGISGGDQIFSINADATRVGIRFTGGDQLSRVDNVALGSVADDHGFYVGALLPLAFDKGTDYDIVMAQQAWYFFVPAGAWLNWYQIFANPVG